MDLTSTKWIDNVQETLLVGSYSMADRGHGRGVVMWRLGSDGSLDETGAAISLGNPSFLIQTGDAVVAVQETRPGAVTVLDPRLGELSRVSTLPLRQDLPCHVATPDDGEHLLVANFASGSISLLTRDASGYRVVDEAHPRPDSQGSRPDICQPHQIVTSRRGTYWISDRGMDRIYEYAIEGGYLHERARIALPAGTGPRHMAEVQDRLLVVGEQDARLHVLDVGGPGIGGRWVRAVPCSRREHAGVEQHPSHLAVNKERSRAYVAVRGLNSIAVFDLANVQSARPLTLLQEHDSGGRSPRHFAIVGDHLVVANQGSDELAALSLDPDTGLIRSIVTRRPSPSPACVLPLDLDPSSN